jgi:hypothetical protein
LFYEISVSFKTKSEAIGTTFLHGEPIGTTFLHGEPTLNTQQSAEFRE